MRDKKSSIKKLYKDRQAFSLIELIIAIQLFILLLLFIGTLIPFSQISARSTSHRDLAIYYGESLINNIRNYPWEGIPKPPSTFIGMSPTEQEQPFLPPPYPFITIKSTYPDPGTLSVTEHNIKYYFVVQTTYEPDNLPDDKKNLLKITVDVYWNEYGAFEKDLPYGPAQLRVPGKKITLSTKIARK